MPSRKTIRDWLQDMRSRSTARALRCVAGDFALFFVLLAGIVMIPLPPLQLGLGVLTGLVIGRLFILGHDACHQSLTAHRSLNRVIGRLLFLPSLTPYSLWEVGHNVVHHGYTNLKGFDFVWAPLTPAEYRQLPRWRRALERIYRSGWAPGLYYGIEIWWLRMFFPRRRYMKTQRRAFFWDSALISIAALAWIAGLVALATATAQSAPWLVICGFAIPFAVFQSLIGFVVYVHHTHPATVWHEDKLAWADAAPFVSTTVHLRMPHGLGSALHHIMEHTAHHVDMGIPLYHLSEAQRRLEARLPGHIVVQDFSWAWYFDTARRCQLFDLKRGQWTRFSAAGKPA